MENKPPTLKNFVQIKMKFFLELIKFEIIDIARFSTTVRMYMANRLAANLTYALQRFSYSIVN